MPLMIIGYLRRICRLFITILVCISVYIGTSSVYMSGTLREGGVMSTSIASGIYEAVRLDIGDPEAQIFSDAFMQRIFIKSVRRLNQSLGLSVTSRPPGVPGYKSLSTKISPITYDLSGDTIFPDNDEIADLIILQMEYVIAKGELSALKRLSSAYGGAYATSVGSAEGDGVTVTNADGVVVSVGASRLNNRTKLILEDANLIKAELNEAIKRFLGRATGNYGKLVY